MLNRDLANAVRILSMDGVQKANSGHPGAPMGMAEIAEVLWRKHLKHNPNNPNWINRDRFILSNGHASMMIYSLLHLSGYDLPLEELKNFRQLGSKTAGHPEYGLTPGVETTTGPLGQGFANAVGAALAEKILASYFNKKDFPIMDHFTYTFLGDGCLMEGVSHESASLAGNLKLGKLIALYDSNGISIDGETKNWFIDDTAARFRSYGWQVIDNIDGHNSKEIDDALTEAKKETEKPTIIICTTTIGFGSPAKSGKASSHGAPLGEDEVKAARKALGWKHEEAFFIPDEIYTAWDHRIKGNEDENAWEKLFSRYADAYPEEAEELTRRFSGKLPERTDDVILKFAEEEQKKLGKTATRKASKAVLDTAAPQIPELLGGSADLSPSNLTLWDGAESITGDNARGNYIRFGVREFGMTAIMNGVSLHGGFIPYTGTFLIFMEYARNAVRMASLMQTRSIFVYTHDSIGLGEDGPTHQPVEQLTSLRTTPHLSSWRPADAVETAVAWGEALKKHDGPTALIFSRQGLQTMERTSDQISLIKKGAYTLWESNGTQVPDLILIATGSELELAYESAKAVSSDFINVRVVSMPSPDTFDKQDSAYQEQVLPAACRKRVAIEAAHKDYWYKYTGLDGAVVGMASFGESAPAPELFKKFGFTVENVVKTIKAL
ncbi:MAG: transketolase [Spirochaetia bacterium]|nr:transketolase [Spirochaetia bacterium]MCF7953717.1 transketolase [Spirochaetales bacterium]